MNIFQASLSENNDIQWLRGGFIAVSLLSFHRTLILQQLLNAENSNSLPKLQSITLYQSNAVHCPVASQNLR